MYLVCVHAFGMRTCILLGVVKVSRGVSTLLDSVAGVSWVQTAEKLAIEVFVATCTQPFSHQRFGGGTRFSSSGQPGPAEDACVSAEERSSAGFAMEKGLQARTRLLKGVDAWP
jgi:hypothetical protein